MTPSFPLSAIQSFPIIEDFMLFVSFVKQRKSFELTKSKMLKIADLKALNEQLHHQALYTNPKSQQPNYPNLELFYHIGLQSKISYIQHPGKSPILKINPEQWDF